MPAEGIGYHDSFGVLGGSPVRRDVDDGRRCPGRKKHVAGQIAMDDLRRPQGTRRLLEQASDLSELLTHVGGLLPPGDTVGGRPRARPGLKAVRARQVPDHPMECPPCLDDVAPGGRLSEIRMRAFYPLLCRPSVTNPFTVHRGDRRSDANPVWLQVAQLVGKPLISRATFRLQHEATRPPRRALASRQGKRRVHAKRTQHLLWHRPVHTRTVHTARFAQWVASLRECLDPRALKEHHHE